jgi:hypothetical protein
VRHPFREKHRPVFSEHPLVENQQKLRAIRATPLNGMRMACGKYPKIAFTHVTGEHIAIGIHHFDSGIAREHVGPFISGMPVQLAIAACSEAHLDTGNVLGRRKDALRHLMGPPALFDALFYQIEGIPDGY